MKGFLIVIGLFLCAVCRVQAQSTTSPSDTLIRWSANYKLTTSDFQEAVQRKDAVQYDTTLYRMKAYSSVLISATIKMVGTQLIVEAAGVFLRNRSWMLDKSEHVLQHEQGHFDIAEIYARRLRKTIQSYQVTDLNAFTAFYQKTYADITAQHRMAQQAYDEATIDAAAQEAYYEKIQRELEAVSGL